jgi:nitrogen fixation protein
MNMNPHVGQDFWLAVTDKATGMELGRVKTTATSDFMVDVTGIENGMSYNVDFYSDHSGNGIYDAPPTDHAWRLELNDVMGDTTLTFTHNTSFTDIMWKNKLTVHFMNMNPHVGQDLWLAVSDRITGIEIGRVKTTATADFMVDVTGIENGMSYNVDFYSDHSGNGIYDAPPTDHAWRLELNDVMGDTTLTFTHNTNFTDIMWKNKLSVHFMNMNPHVGQMLKLFVVDEIDGMTIDTVTIDEIMDAEFEVNSYKILSGHSYDINFFADFNKNGSYDAPPTDHAWQLKLENVTGDTTLYFTHNTNFTDIFNTTATSVNILNKFRLYPNPADKFITIETAELNSSNVAVTIYDITGKLKNIDNELTNNKITLNVQDLAPGMYFVGLKTNTHNRIIKWIKD